MSKNILINISDLHTKQTNTETITARLEALKNYIEVIKLKHDCKKVTFIVSGDIAYSGKCSEYNLLLSSFEQLNKLGKVILCPGNHDNDFSGENEAGNVLLKSMPLNSIIPELREVVLKNQSNYREFEDLVCDISATESGQLSKTFKTEEISITSLNTAWCSSIREESGKLYFPPDEIQKQPKGCVRVIFFHHPLSWLEANNNKEIRNIIRSNYDILISGHEHIADSFSVEDDEYKLLMVESISFFDEYNEENGFLSIVIDENDIILEKHTWSGRDYDLVQTKRKSELIKFNEKKVGDIDISNEFYKNLYDLGAGFHHTCKEKVCIPDIFVYPNISIESSNDKLKRISSEEILNKENLKKYGLML